MKEINVKHGAFIKELAKVMPGHKQALMRLAEEYHAQQAGTCKTKTYENAAEHLKQAREEGKL